MCKTSFKLHKNLVMRVEIKKKLLPFPSELHTLLHIIGRYLFGTMGKENIFALELQLQHTVPFPGVLSASANI